MLTLDGLIRTPNTASHVPGHDRLPRARHTLPLVMAIMSGFFDGNSVELEETGLADGLSAGATKGLSNG